MDICACIGDENRSKFKFTGSVYKATFFTTSLSGIASYVPEPKDNFLSH